MHSAHLQAFSLHTLGSVPGKCSHSGSNQHGVTCVVDGSFHIQTSISLILPDLILLRAQATSISVVKVWEDLQPALFFTWACSSCIVTLSTKGACWRGKRQVAGSTLGWYLDTFHSS